MRAIVLALTLACASAAPAWAQKAETAPPTVAAPVGEMTPERISAGGELFQAIMFDSGLFDMAFDPMVGEVIPQLRQSVTSSQLYLGASRRHRESLLAFVDSLPDRMRQELMTELGTVRDRVAPRFAALMTPEELAGLADFMRSPDTRVIFQRYMASYMEERRDGQTRQPNFTDEELSVFTGFITSPAGLAFVREGDNISAIMNEEFDAATVRMQPRLEMMMQTGICDALENECPRPLRERLGRT